LLQIAERGLVIAPGVIDHRDGIQRGPFALAVADLLADRQRLRQVAERGLVIVPGFEDLRDVAQRSPFARSVADLLLYRQRLLQVIPLPTSLFDAALSLKREHEIGDTL